MKKFDLHIHTIPTVCEESFEFSIDTLIEYVRELSIDCIAITNHNLFSRTQFEEISKLLPIKVLAGIEVSLGKGHILIIAPEDLLTDFSVQCALVSEKIRLQNDSLTMGEFNEIFPDLNRYLVIPHYRKHPVLPQNLFSELRRYISCGEVSSIKDFVKMSKSSDELAPVYFSDMRAKTGLIDFPARCTYLEIDEISIPAIKTVLQDKTKVSLSDSVLCDLAEVLSNGLKISTKLTIVLGERSTGKTYTLNSIAKHCENPKYIKQFELLSMSEEKENSAFQNNILNSKADYIKEYLEPLQKVIDDILSISLERNDELLQAYINRLLKVGEEIYKEDAFSKTVLFREEPYSSRTFSELIELIQLVIKLLENDNYSELIFKYINQTNLTKLLIALTSEYSRSYEAQLKKNYTNEILHLIQIELQSNTSAETIPSFNFYQYLLDKVKIEVFEKIANFSKIEREIHRVKLGKYEVVINAKPFDGARSLKNVYGKKDISFSEAFNEYADPYLYLKKLANLTIPVTEISKYYIDFECKVLNQYGYEASGGERSEFNLLKHLEDATQHDILIIDEPESSFDNPFLKNFINETLKRIAQIIPVVIATHNNTIGASIKPDYIIYTKNEIQPDGTILHKLFSGYPTNRHLVELEGDKIDNQFVQFECLEAGQPAYYERKQIYENFEN